MLPYLGYENVQNIDEFKNATEGLLFTSNPKVKYSYIINNNYTCIILEFILKLI